MTGLRPSSLLPKFLMETLTFTLSLSAPPIIIPSLRSPSLSPLRRCSLGWRFLASSAGGTRLTTSGEEGPSVEFSDNPFPIAGAEEALLGFLNGKRKATEVAHSVWKYIIHGGDTVVDATYGNGYDTVALLKLIADDSRRGRVYGLDIQNSALENTSCLLREAIDENERELVKLSLLCHSKMEDIIPKDVAVRLIAFNLGYLPGGDKSIITKPHTTILALQAASRILRPGGLISIVVYVGHPGGWEELESVLLFVSSLPVESWVSFKYEAVDRPNGPVLLFIFKKRWHMVVVISFLDGLFQNYLGVKK